MINLTSTSTTKDIEKHWYSITKQPIENYHLYHYRWSFKYGIYELIDIINKSIKDNKLYPLIGDFEQIFIYKNEMYYDDSYYDFEDRRFRKEKSYESKFNDLRKKATEKLSSYEIIKLVCLSNIYYFKANNLSTLDSIINECIYIYYNLDNLLLKGE